MDKRIEFAEMDLRSEWEALGHRRARQHLLNLSSTLLTTCTGKEPAEYKTGCHPPPPYHPQSRALATEISIPDSKNFPTGFPATSLIRSHSHHLQTTVVPMAFSSHQTPITSISHPAFVRPGFGCNYSQSNSSRL